MKIYNQEKTEILENPDLEKGYLTADKLFIKTIPAQEEVQEQFHYEYKYYQNGGADRKKVVDVEYQPAVEEHDEYEDIQVYIPYAEEELAKIKQQKYENLIVSKIRERYTLDQELAILRQRDTKPEEFTEYNDYVEQCKVDVKQLKQQ